MKKIPKNNEINRRALYDKLLERKAFWSYDRVPYENFGDELLIEKVLEELELEDIHLLFSLYALLFTLLAFPNTMGVARGFDMSALQAVPPINRYFNSVVLTLNTQILNTHPSPLITSQ